MISDTFFLKSKTRKHSEKQKNKQGEILISPFIGSLLFYFVQFGQLKKKNQKPKRLIIDLSVLAI